MSLRKTTAYLMSKRYLLVAALSVFFGSFLLLSGRAFAGGGVGTGGGATGGGSTAGYGTRNGHGWLLYDANGPGPSGGFRNGTAWGTVQGICRGANASGVMVFGIANSSGNVKGYNYIQDYSVGHWSDGSSVDFGRATAINTFWAKAAFDDLPNKGVSTAGFTFGGSSGNVAWFCTGIDNVNHDPAGDSAMNCTAGFQGWVLDADDLNARLGIAIVIKPPGTGWNDPTSFKINATANQPIPDPPFNTAALGAFGVGGNRGFTIALPAQFKNGSNYDWLILAANAAGTPSNPLGFSILGQGTFNCPVPSISFRINPKANAELKPDAEDPNQVILKAGITSNIGTGVKGGTVKRSYYVKKIAGGTAPLPGVVDKNDNRTLTSFDYPDETVAVNPATLQPGDSICVLVFVSPASGSIDSTGNLLSTGTPATDSIEGCDRFVNRPYVSFSGGDVAAGGSFGGGSCGTGEIKTNSKGAAPWGSAAQLAVQAVGAIDGLPSARWRTSPPGPANGLSFANDTGTGTYGGGFGACQSMPDYFADASALTPSTKSGAVAVPTVSSSQYWTVPAGGSVTLDSGGSVNIPINTHVKLYIKGDVTIAHDITYAGAGSWANTDQIPSFQLYVKGNIYISNNVRQLDGVYVAQPNGPPTTDGVISTCSEAGSGPNRLGLIYQNCSQKLTVYGAFMARHVDLLRSANTSLRNSVGDRPLSPNNAAEQFILSPEAFIANYNDNPTTCTTSPNECGPVLFYQTSLPPIL